MATLESLRPHIYLLTETRNKFFGSPEDVRSVTLLVNGVSAIFNVSPHYICFKPALCSEYSLWRPRTSIIYKKSEIL